MDNGQDKIIPIFIEEEMRNSYIDYSMSVIVARALPDIRDGLKPVHRRVLYGMLELGLRPNTPYKKSARIVGEVLGKYHPHGDAAVYDAMVRMVQDFSLRYPLVDGQGNFGSIDGDAPAAMRYTEARLAAIAEQVVRDLDKDTVDFVPNFDETLKEPTVLPSLLPTLLVNGAAGIAVGMATNIPPHNLKEVVDALIAVIDQPDIKPEGIKKYLKGPDFPTGAIIAGDEEILSYFKTGRGKLTVRAKAHIEEVTGGRKRIVVTEIPYQVNKSSLIERIAELVKDKKIENIYDIRDESDRDGMRIVFELKKEADAEAVLKDLYRLSQMQTTFGVIMLALVNGQPKILNIKQILTEFIDFRHEVVLRRTKFELEKAEQRAHILEGLKIALDNIDAIISLIRRSKDVETAKKGLIKNFKLSEIQAQAILDMRLQKLTGLERKKIEEEYLGLIKLIEKLKSLLKSKSLRMQLIKEEFLQLKEAYGDNRKTQILAKNSQDSLSDLISEEEYVIALTKNGQVARIALKEYNDQCFESISQNKDYIRYLLKAKNSQQILLFSKSGKAFLTRTSFIPLVINNQAGVSIANLLHFKAEENIIACFPVPLPKDQWFVFMSTQKGLVKKVTLKEFDHVKDGGTQAISLQSDDSLISIKLTDGKQEIILATANGKCIRFKEEDVREMGLSAQGIKGISLEENDETVSMVAIKNFENTLVSVTEHGFGKRSRLKEYSVIRRGGKGIVNYKLSDKVGKVVEALESLDTDIINVVTKKGKFKRIKAKEIKIMGRATHGSAMLNLYIGDKITDVFMLEKISK